MSADVKKLIDESKISRFQIGAIGICFVILLLDGFDALAMSFTGPTISSEWGLSGMSLGMLFSASLVGMAIGAIFIAPIADKIGRRSTVITSLAIVTVGMAAAAVSETFNQLLAMRLLTGIGVGAALAGVNILVAEYAPAKQRSLAIGILQAGYPLGAMLGGVVAALAIASQGWQSVFIIGAVGSALMLPIAIFLLPESIDFLLVRRPADALHRINRQLVRMGHAEISELPSAPEVKTKRGLPGLFAPEFRRSTILLWITFFMVMFCLYFILSWTPKLLVASGLSTTQGISGGVLLHIGGICGQLLLGFLATRFRLYKVMVTYFGLAAMMMLVFAVVLNDLSVAFIIAPLIGAFVLGAITGSYAITHSLYPSEIRTTALGWAIGIGRIGAIVSPLAAGHLLDDGIQVSYLYVLFSVPMLLGMFAIRSLGNLQMRHNEEIGVEEL